MIEAIKRLNLRKIEPEDEKILFPLMKWTSGNIENITICNYINEKFFYCDKSILIKCLSLGLRNRTIPKYPKPKKFDKTKYDLVVSLLKKKYFLGPNDIVSARKVIEKIISNPNELEKLANEFGLDNKERKKLGIKQIKFDEKKVVKKKTKGLFDF